MIPDLRGPDCLGRDKGDLDTVGVRSSIPASPTLTNLRIYWPVGTSPVDPRGRRASNVHSRKRVHSQTAPGEGTVATPPSPPRCSTPPIMPRWPPGIYAGPGGSSRANGNGAPGRTAQVSGDGRGLRWASGRDGRSLPVAMSLTMWDNWVLGRRVPEVGPAREDSSP